MGTRLRLLTPEAQILKALEKGPKTASELEAETGLPKSTFYRSVKDLLLAGLIERKEVVDGSVVYVITSEGRKALDRAREELAPRA